MNCDVCNNEVIEGDGECVTPDIFSYLLDNGFGIDEENIGLLTSSGMTWGEAEATLKSRYRERTSDWFVCKRCSLKALSIISQRTERWISPDYISVTRTAEEAGLGFATLGAPVALSRTVWDQYVRWSDEDSERQIHQEQDARLWDILFTGGASLEPVVGKFLEQRIHIYSITCVPRSGVDQEAMQVALVIRQRELRGQPWLVIETVDQGFADNSDSRP